MFMGVCGPKMECEAFVNVILLSIEYQTIKC